MLNIVIVDSVYDCLLDATCIVAKWSNRRNGHSSLCSQI